MHKKKLRSGILSKFTQNLKVNIYIYIAEPKSNLEYLTYFSGSPHHSYGTVIIQSNVKKKP